MEVGCWELGILGIGSSHRDEKTVESSLSLRQFLLRGESSGEAHMACVLRSLYDAVCRLSLSATLRSPVSLHSAVLHSFRNRRTLGQQILGNGGEIVGLQIDDSNKASTTQ